MFWICLRNSFWEALGTESGWLNKEEFLLTTFTPKNVFDFLCNGFLLIVELGFVVSVEFNIEYISLCNCVLSKWFKNELNASCNLGDFFLNNK